MSDPFETLKHLDEGTAGPALPATEVRRRGDRMRRRRMALRALGAACAVAVITTGGIAAGGGMTGSTPQPPPATQEVQPTPGPTESTAPRPVLIKIPDDFPLADGYPAVTGSDQSLVGPGHDVRAFDDVTACNRLAYPTVEPADRLAVTFTQPEDLRNRELTTYADDASAREALTTLVERFGDCGRESFGGTPESVTLSEVRPTGLGDESYAVVQTYETDGLPAIGLSQVHVVRVGNALLVSSSSNEGGGDRNAVEVAVRAEKRALAPLAAAMCVFAPAGCGEASEPEPEPPGDVDASVMTLDDVRAHTGQLTTDRAVIPDRRTPRSTARPTG